MGQGHTGKAFFCCETCVQVFSLDVLSLTPMLIDGQHVQVGVVAHGQRARNRRGGHHQKVRLLAVSRYLAAQGQALRLAGERGTGAGLQSQPAVAAQYGF